MLPTTTTAITAILRADPSLTPIDRGAISNAIKNHGAGFRPEAAPTPRLLKRAEAARRLGCCPRTIDCLARAGSLRRVLLPGRSRGAGFIEADVTRLIEGGVADANP